MPSQDVYGYCMAYAGARPGNQSAAEARMINSILNDGAVIPVTGDDIRPDVPLPAACTEPVDVPNVGTGNATGGPGHPAIAGYDTSAVTPLEAWLRQKHMAAMGIPAGAGNYDPNVPQVALPVGRCRGVEVACGRMRCVAEPRLISN
jgi:hypothetical protein